jgi:hypothetical protein
MDEQDSDRVELPFDSIWWKICPVVREDLGDGIAVELQWGWTAGMSEEELKNWADDAPTGYESVTTTLDMADELADKLKEIVKKYRDRDKELRSER